MIQKKHEFRGMDRRQFLLKFGATSAAILYGFKPSTAHGIIPFGFIRNAGCVNTPGGTHITGASGSSTYTTPGTYKWCIPSGVTSVCVVCVGGGGGGGGAPGTANTAYGGGGGGSGGSDGTNSVNPPGIGGAYGGGGPGSYYYYGGGPGGSGAVRIIWGSGRSFPINAS